MSLKTVVNDSGFRLSYLAEKLNISRQSLLNKLDGSSEFKESEIIGICKLLNMSLEDFFNLDK